MSEFREKPYFFWFHDDMVIETLLLDFLGKSITVDMNHYGNI